MTNERVQNPYAIGLPTRFGFKAHDLYDFETVLGWFDWSLRNRNVLIDMRRCRSANYQALSLVVLYTWHLRMHGCNVRFKFEDEGASLMWHLMGARGWSHVLYQPDQNFKGNRFKPLLAIRNQPDFGSALNRAEDYTKGFDIEYEKTLRYVISELLYNTLEHGQKWFNDGKNRCPSIIQFTWYARYNEIAFIIADLGVGIKRHLENAYPPFETDLDAIRYAIRPQVSGTFTSTATYGGKNNAGVGLYLSTNIIQRLRAEMFIVSGKGLLHISPRDITGKELTNGWPGTFVFGTMQLSRKRLHVNLHSMMAEFRESAKKEIATSEIRDLVSRLDVNIENYFGRYAENKEEAVKFRDRHLMSALAEGKSILLDFANVISAPHSFLSALLATPIQFLGIGAYKRLKITNAVPEIRETIDFILDENTTNA